VRGVTTATERIQPLVQAVRLREVRLVAGSATTRVRSPGEAKDAAVSFDWSTRTEQVTDTAFCVAVEFSAQLKSAAERIPPWVALGATFELSYGLDAPVAASGGDLRAFAELNGVFNAWPYWREYVQSMTTRMGLPPLVVPVFRLSAAREHEAGDARRAPGRRVSGSARRTGNQRRP
jgi:preprotein translocase subunit SecB